MKRKIHSMGEIKKIYIYTHIIKPEIFRKKVPVHYLQ